MADRSDFHSRNSYQKDVARIGRFRAHQTKAVIAATKRLLIKMVKQTTLLDNMITKYHVNPIK